MSKVGMRAFSVAKRDSGHVEKLRDFRTTDLSDGMRKLGTMTGLSAVTAGAPALLGNAVTVSAPAEGFDIVKAGLDLCGHGDVLVVSARTLEAGAVSREAIWARLTASGITVPAATA